MLAQKNLFLNEISGYNNLVKYYDQNKHKPWYDWLKVKSIFPRPGKQGLAGIMTNEDETITYVFKVSNYINYLVQHEFSVMSALNSISNFCPNFCRSIGGIICEIDPVSRKKDEDNNPFVAKSPYLIEKEVLLMEYVERSSKFYNYIRSSNTSDDILYSIVKQTLLAVAVAQNKKGFTHYDLHSNNIMVKKCDRNLVFLYVLDENNQFCVPSHGCYPVIIDFGYAFVKDMEGEPMWPSLGHTSVGFLSDRTDPIADPKLFLVTVSDEIHSFHKTSKSKKLKNITKNLFHRLPIDWDSGWDNNVEKSASDYIADLLSEYYIDSPLFKDFDVYCYDILQTLVILPLQKQDYSNIGIVYNTFITEFSKIEQEIGVPFYCLHILKGIVDSARSVQGDYRNPGSRKHAIDYFRVTLHEQINSVVKFCRPKNIHYEKMLCSLLCLGKCIEGVLYEAMDKRLRKKDKTYRKLAVKSIEEIIGIVNLNITDDYQYNENTTVMVIDCIHESCQIVKLTGQMDLCEELNNTESICHGAMLYEQLNN